jgi:excisionase family DNA binding protein
MTVKTLVSVKRAAEILEVTETRVYRLIREGEFKSVSSINGRRLIPLTEIRHYQKRRDSWLTIHGRHGKARKENAVEGKNSPSTAQGTV